MFSGTIQQSVYAASKTSLPPAIRRPNPDLIVHGVSGHCEKKPNGSWVLKATVTIKNQTGTPTASGFVTSVGARLVTFKTKTGFKTIGMSFGEYTTAAGFNNTKTLTIEEPIAKNLVRITNLGGIVDKDKQVHEKNEGNNQKVNSGSFECVK